MKQYLRALAAFCIFMTAMNSYFAVLSAYSVEEMTLSEKVGQLLMTQFSGEKANEDAVRLIQDLHIGGIIYYN